ncbi:hypothetical protein SAMN05428642_103193 [Flaviramulus basaltis]|uniref:Sugar phosphate isomerase/epimerase n=1 Tax=Flaviramulus basaltis TaxID=369401 RepID=A0A1K2IML0_9FLAO|nr:hypothetical protein [Flaviramulus basaltis]SFZ93542.1 hypothetical protein SAMN05428642_103193 [Flaviramulus basaltis]
MLKIKFLYPYWGSEHLTPTSFIDLAISNGFDGIEINIPNKPVFETDFYNSLNTVRLANPNFVCVLQQVFEIKNETPQDYLIKVLNRLENMVHYKPNFINSHTGKDHYSFSENCKIIDAIEEFALKSKTPIYHEIHRGRFTFHSATTLQYLEVFPQLKLVGDLSHWWVVSESMLQDQEEIINKVIPHIHHIHARVGFEQAPQVNNPFAPEWNKHLHSCLDFWQRIIRSHDKNRQMAITPEFGPFPYMPQSPFDQKPMANQHDLNITMKAFLEQHLTF